MQQLTLKALRAQYDLTAKQVAEQVGVHQQTLLKYEHDSTKIPHDLLRKLADLYKVKTDYIFLGKKYELNHIKEN